MQSYPMPNQYTEEMEIIPGGPKLPRTPQGPQSVGGVTSGGRTPAPSPEEGFAMSPAQLQQSPRVSFAPGSQASTASHISACYSRNNQSELQSMGMRGEIKELHRCSSNLTA